jgi:sulfate adenylyltransferase subunit 1 (EFTu-like GTPase family)
MKHGNHLYNESRHHIRPVIMTGSPGSGKTTLMARLLYETGGMPRETVKEIKRISRELGKETGQVFIIDQWKKEQEKSGNQQVSYMMVSSGKKKYSLINPQGCGGIVQGLISGIFHTSDVIIIIDISEGAAEQAEKYAHLFSICHIRNCIVAFNKMDRIQYDEKKYLVAKEEVLGLLSGFSLYPPAAVPLSALEGVHVTKQSKKTPWYKGLSLLKVLDAMQPEKNNRDRPFLFSVQDTYQMNSESVNVGKILSGLVKRGEPVVIYPPGKKARIAEIKVFLKKKVRKAGAGENPGLVLEPDIPVKRGDIIAHREADIQTVTSFSASIVWSAAHPLQTGDRITSLVAAQRVACRVERVEKTIHALTLEKIKNNNGVLSAGEAGKVTLTVESPVVIQSISSGGEFGRIILVHNERVAGAGFIG